MDKLTLEQLSPEQISCQLHEVYKICIIWINLSLNHSVPPPQAVDPRHATACIHSIARIKKKVTAISNDYLTRSNGCVQRSKIKYKQNIHNYQIHIHPSQRKKIKETWNSQMLGCLWYNWYISFPWEVEIVLLPIPYNEI